MLVLRSKNRVLFRPLFFTFNSRWHRHIVCHLPGFNCRIGYLFRSVVFTAYSFYQTMSNKMPSVNVLLPGGFQNPNHFCFAHALFQVLFASKEFSKYFSPEEHRLKKFRHESLARLHKRQTLQQLLYNIRQKILSHKTVNSKESYRLRHRFHQVNREIPLEGEWDLCEFFDTVAVIMQTPPFDFDLDLAEQTLPYRFSASSFYLNPNLLERSKLKKPVPIHAIPILKEKMEISPQDPRLFERLPEITLKNILLNSRKTPEYLSIQISRFDVSDWTSYRKNFIHLDQFNNLKFGLDNLKSQVHYQLIGSCEHEGNVLTGHYYSLIRYPLKGKCQWIKCSSSSVTLFNSHKLYDIIGRKGCFLFYEKV